MEGGNRTQIQKLIHSKVIEEGGGRLLFMSRVSGWPIYCMTVLHCDSVVLKQERSLCMKVGTHVQNIHLCIHSFVGVFSGTSHIFWVAIAGRQLCAVSLRPLFLSSFLCSLSIFLSFNHLNLEKVVHRPKSYSHKYSDLFVLGDINLNVFSAFMCLDRQTRKPKKKKN